MTGYGRGEASGDRSRITVEMKAVNRRQAEVVVRLPRELDLLEARFREEILRSISRGRVEVTVTLVLMAGNFPPRINSTLAAVYAKELSALVPALGLTGGVTLEVLLRCPGVMETSSAQEDPEALWSIAEPALKEALSALDAMRQREGVALAKDLNLRIDEMREAADRIRRQLPEIARRFREQLLQRIAAAGIPNIAADDERVIREVVFFADRSDISEELTRLESHFNQYQECRGASEPLGRKLDFLAQEMNREVNTIGSKANDSVVASEVIRLKTELERFREQAQNIE